MPWCAAVLSGVVAVGLFCHLALQGLGIGAEWESCESCFGEMGLEYLRKFW